MLIDRTGLNRVINIAVALWSCAGIANRLDAGFTGLLGCRAVLGAGEAAGIPRAGKADSAIPATAERALGNAMNQAGVMLGMVAGPAGGNLDCLQAGWRAAFVATGVLGLLWIPIWNWAAAPQRPPRRRSQLKPPTLPACCATAGCGPSCSPTRSA